MCSSPRCASASASMFGPGPTRNAEWIAAVTTIPANAQWTFNSKAATADPARQIWSTVRRPQPRVGGVPPERVRDHPSGRATRDHDPDPCRVEPVVPLEVQREEREERRDREPDAQEQPLDLGGIGHPESAHPPTLTVARGCVRRSGARVEHVDEVPVALGDRGHRRVAVRGPVDVCARGVPPDRIARSRTRRRCRRRRGASAPRPRRPRPGRAPRTARRRDRRRSRNPPAARAPRSSTGRAGSPPRGARRSPAPRARDASRRRSPPCVARAPAARAAPAGTRPGARGATVCRSSNRSRCRPFIAASPDGLYRTSTFAQVGWIASSRSRQSACSNANSRSPLASTGTANRTPAVRSRSIAIPPIRGVDEPAGLRPVDP